MKPDAMAGAWEQALPIDDGRPTRGELRWANRPADPSRGRVDARES